MIRRAFFLGCFLFAVALTGLGYYYGRKIPFSGQWPLYEALRNTASIIFAVVGAWLAIIYPERLKISFGRQQGDGSSSGGTNMWLLLMPAVHSTILLVILLLVGVMAPLAKQIPQLFPYATQLRGASFALVAALTCWQVTIVIMTLLPVETVQSRMDKEAARSQLEKQRGKLYRK